MTRTLGDLVDRLSIVNLKIWFCQEKVYECARDDLPLPAEVNRNLASLNLERNKLMTAVDNCLADAVSSGRAEVEDRVKLT